MTVGRGDGVGDDECGRAVEEQAATSDAGAESWDGGGVGADDLAGVDGGDGLGVPGGGRVVWVDGAGLPSRRYPAADAVEGRAFSGGRGGGVFGGWKGYSDRASNHRGASASCGQRRG